MNDTPINDLDGAGESDASLEQLVVALAHRRGIRDVNELTSLVFCARHPAMGGRKIQSHETALAQEWIDVRDSVVRPARPPPVRVRAAMNRHADSNGRSRSMLLLAVVVACWIGLATANRAFAMGAGSPSEVASADAMVVAPVGTTLRLTPGSGPPGTVVDVEGVGWPRGVFDVEAVWGVGGKPMTPQDLDVDDFGELSGTVTIPDDATPGRDEEIKVCAAYGDGVDSSTRCVSKMFSVEPEPAVEPELFADPFEGHRGTAVELSGRWTDRAAGKDVSATIFWRPNDVALGSAVISPDGTIAGKIAVPLGVAVGGGAIEVCVDQATGRGECVLTYFEVLVPTLESDPTEATPGSNLRLTGTGWCCADGDVDVTDSATGERWGAGTVDENGTLTADATVPNAAVDGSVELEVCSDGDCRSTAVSVIPPELPDTTAPPATTESPPATDPTTTESPRTTDPTTTDPTTTESPRTTDATTTDRPQTSDPVIFDGDPPGGIGEVVVPGLIAGGGAGLVVSGLVWRRFKKRRHVPGVVPQVIPRPDAGHQSVFGHGGPAITVTAVLDIGHKKPTLHFRRTP